jgi:hypothetical protein
MLSRMQTNDVNDPVEAAFEACATFAAEGDGSPVCVSCGWLGTDHAPDDAQSRGLAARDAMREATRDAVRAAVRKAA